MGGWGRVMWGGGEMLGRLRCCRVRGFGGGSGWGGLIRKDETVRHFFCIKISCSMNNSIYCCLNSHSFRILITT